MNVEQINSIEAQIFVLQQRLEKNPEVIGTKPDGGKLYNPTHFSLKNKIKSLQKQLNELKNPSGIRAWNNYLAK